jgi:hypothetical protein
MLPPEEDASMVVAERFNDSTGDSNGMRANANHAGNFSLEACTKAGIVGASVHQGREAGSKVHTWD